MPRKCGIYVRVSTAMQVDTKDGSLDTQESELKKFLEMNSTNEEKWELVDLYREEARSGKNTKRPQLKRLLDDIRSRTIDTVIVTRIDRFTRSIIDFYKIWEVFQEYDVEFISKWDSFDTSTPIGRAMLNIILVFAQLERETVSDRTRKKMQWRAEQGLWNGGRLLGYKIDPENSGVLIFHKEEKKLVKLIFEKYLELGSVSALVKYLHEHGYKTPQFESRRGRKGGGRKFYKSGIFSILSNPAYTGKIRFGENIYEGKHKGIISEELFKKVNDTLKEHAPKRRNFKAKRKYVFLLQGLIRCGKCGSYMTPRSSTGRNDTYFYYECTKANKSEGIDCDAQYVPADSAEQAVVEEIKDISLDKKQIEEIVRRANEESSKALKSLKKEKKDVEKKLFPVRQKTENMAETIAKEGIKAFKTLEKKLSELETIQENFEDELSEIEQKIKSEKNRTVNAQEFGRTLKSFSQIAEAATHEELKSLIPRVVDHITWHWKSKGQGLVEIAFFSQFTGSASESANKTGAQSIDKPALVRPSVVNGYPVTTPNAPEFRSNKVPTVKLSLAFFTIYNKKKSYFIFGEKPDVFAHLKKIRKKDLDMHAKQNKSKKK